MTSNKSHVRLVVAAPEDHNEQIQKRDQCQMDTPPAVVHPQQRTQCTSCSNHTECQECDRSRKQRIVRPDAKYVLQRCRCSCEHEQTNRHEAPNRDRPGPHPRGWPKSSLHYIPFNTRWSTGCQSLGSVPANNHVLQRNDEPTQGEQLLENSEHAKQPHNSEKRICSVTPAV